AADVTPLPADEIPRCSRIEDEGVLRRRADDLIDTHLAHDQARGLGTAGADSVAVADVDVLPRVHLEYAGDVMLALVEMRGRVARERESNAGSAGATGVVVPTARSIRIGPGVQ